MAGGMSKRGGWGPMTQRVADSQPPSRAPVHERPSAPSAASAPSGPVSPGAAAAPPSGPTSRLKHCWVSDEHGRLPALLLEWRRTEGGYQGRVVRPVLDRELGWVVVEEWLPASFLEPA